MLIDENTLSRRTIIIDEDFYKRGNVFERLGKSKITPERLHSEVSNPINQSKQPKPSGSTNQNTCQEKQIARTSEQHRNHPENQLDKRTYSTQNQQTKAQHSQPKTYMFDFWILILGLKCKIIRTPANKNINKTLRQ